MKNEHSEKITPLAKDPAGIPRRMQKARIDKGLTLSQLAELSGASAMAISAIENGETGYSLHDLDKARKVLGVSLSYVMDGEEGLKKDAIAELKTLPRWETLEQCIKRTGEPWKGAVYFNLLAKRDGHSVYIGDKYQTCSVEEALEIIDRLENKQHCHDYTPVIICANSDFGKPPDGWRPENK
jgi:transcriptional regulator with XRE-family HTH domain